MNNRQLNRQIRDLRSRKKANSFFYFLSHSFLFRRFFYDDLPSEYLAKEGIGLTLTILSYLYRFTRKIIYFLIIRTISNSQLSVFLTLMLFLGIAREPFNGIFLFNEDDYDLIILMKANPKDYGRYLLKNYLLEQGLLYGLAGLFIAASLNVSYLRVLYWIILRLAITYVTEGINLMISEKRGRYVTQKLALRLALAAACLIVCALAVFFDICLPVLFLELAGILLVIGGVGAWLYLWNFDKYDVLFKYNLLQLTISGKNKNLVIDGVDYTDLNRKIKIREKEEKTNRTGYRYIYRLFLSRYRRSILPGFIGCVIFSLLPVAVFIFLADTALFTDILEIEITGDTIYRMMPNMFFLMYIFTSRPTKQFIQLCFFQLDRHLINYNFYRTRDSIMENLHLRLRTVMLQNLTIGLILGVGMSVAMALHSDTVVTGKVAVCFLLPLVLAVFFSFFNITSYYLLQPYSFEGTVVNKTYPVIDGVFYLVSYILMEVHLTISLPVLTIITIVLAAVSAIMYVLVMKKAPKAFRVK